MSTDDAPSGPAPRVLLVEDDPLVRRYLRATLPSHGFRLLEAGDAAEAERLATQWPPDVVLLDLGLPDADGVEVLQALRRWSAAPVIVLSARGAEREKVRLLDAGADDYLTKPFGFPELLARLRAALRRVAQSATRDPSGSFAAQGLVVDAVQRRVLREGVPVHLTPTEWSLLLTLVRHAGKVVTQTMLLDAVWGPDHETEAHALRVHMANLRRKLESDPVRPRLLLTEPGVGYRLSAE